MESTIIAAVIGAIAAVVGPIVAALLSRKRKVSDFKDKRALSGQEARKSISKTKIETGKPEELEIIWRCFLTEANDDNLEQYLHKVELLIRKHPNEEDGLILKSLIVKALEAKSKRRLIGPPPRHPLHMLATRLYSKLLSATGKGCVHAVSVPDMI